MLRTITLSFVLLTLAACGCSAAPEEGAAQPPPQNARDQAVQSLQAREALLGSDGSTEALQKTLEIRDARDAEQQQATEAAGAE